MKIRETINNNAEYFTARVLEDNKKIIVEKYGYTLGPIECEVFEFNSIEEYENWKAKQEWIKKEKVKKVSAFKKVPLKI